MQAGGHRFDPVQLHQGLAAVPEGKLVWTGVGARERSGFWPSGFCPLLFDIVDRFVWPAFRRGLWRGVSPARYRLGPAEKKC